MGSNRLKLVFDKGPRMGAIFDFLPKKCVRIGRIVRGNNVTVKDDGISQNHLRIEFDGENWTISDLDSSNGTLLNDEKIPPSLKFTLNDGCVVKIGEETEFTVRIENLVEEEGDAAVEKSSCRVLPRRTRAKKDVVLESDVSKVPSQKNGPVDKDVAVSHGSQVLRQREGTYSSQVDSSLPLETCKDPKLVTKQNLDVNEQHDLSECQIKTDLPPLPAAKRPGRKKKTEANTGIQESLADSLNVPSYEGSNVSSNQSRRIMPSRGAAKRGMTQRNQDAAPEAFDSKEFADVNLISSVQQNNEPLPLPGDLAQRRGRPRGAAKSSSVKIDHSQVADIDVETSKELGASEIQNQDKVDVPLNSIDEPLCVKINPTRDQPRRKAPRRGATRKDMTEKKHDSTSEVFGDLKEVAGGNVVSSGQLNDDFTALPEEMPQLHVPQRIVAKRSHAKKDPSLVSGISGSLDAFGKGIELNNKDNIVDHEKVEPEHNLQDTVAFRENTGTEMNASTDEVPLDVRQESVPENSEAPVKDGPRTRNANRRVKKTGKRTRQAAKVSDIEQEEELDLPERNVQHDKVSDINQSKVGETLKRSIRDIKDLESITLEEWFDRMEKHLPAKVDAVADEIIAKMRQRQKQFEEFVLAHYNK